MAPESSLLCWPRTPALAIKAPKGAAQFMSRLKPWVLAVAGALAATAPPAQEARAFDCTVGPFIVYFDWNEDRLTPQTRSILDDSVSAYKTCGIFGRMILVGY